VFDDNCDLLSVKRIFSKSEGAARIDLHISLELRALEGSEHPVEPDASAGEIVHGWVTLKLLT
jgi:hypothetical protein